jgi:hypothetical protein
MVRAKVVYDLVQPGLWISVRPELRYCQDERFLDNVFGVLLGQAVPVRGAPDERQEVVAVEALEGGPGRA